MKHILNNLSEEEKNAIREQHIGGMKVMTENFSKLINSKLGDSKPLVSEQMESPLRHQHTYIDLKNRYKSYGFTEDIQPGFLPKDKIYYFTKGEDSNGISIVYDTEEGSVKCFIKIDGKTIATKGGKPDGINDDKIFKEITQIVDKYKNFKFKKTPYQG
jgi:hypothetical protein